MKPRYAALTATSMTVAIPTLIYGAHHYPTVTSAAFIAFLAVLGWGLIYILCVEQA